MPRAGGKRGFPNMLDVIDVIYDGVLCSHQRLSDRFQIGVDFLHNLQGSVFSATSEASVYDEQPVALAIFWHNLKFVC